MKTIGIIQARMGSHRLPMKMLMDLNGYPLIEWIIKRVSKAKNIDEFVAAIPQTKENDELSDHLESFNVNVFRGSENDVLNRFYEASIEYSADLIVRICGDNPLICASELDRLVEFYKANNCDYAYNHMPRNNRYPDGLGAEICSFMTLDKINNVAIKEDHREHVFNFVWENKEDFIIKTFDPPEIIAYPHLKFDVDTQEDLDKLRLKDYKISMEAKEIIELNIQKDKRKQ